MHGNHPRILFFGLLKSTSTGQIDCSNGNWLPRMKSFPRLDMRRDVVSSSRPLSLSRSCPCASAPDLRFEGSQNLVPPDWCCLATDQGPLNGNWPAGSRLPLLTHTHFTVACPVESQEPDQICLLLAYVSRFLFLAACFIRRRIPSLPAHFHIPHPDPFRLVVTVAMPFNTELTRRLGIQGRSPPFQAELAVLETWLG